MMALPLPDIPEEVRVIDDFQILNRIGGGGFSQVHMAYHVPSRTYCAAKIVDIKRLNAQEFEGISREISVFMQVSHPNICHLYKLSYTENEIIFFIEYAAGGTLLHHVNIKRGLSESETQKIFCQLFDAVRHLHLTYFCAHRDLKLENVLLDHQNKVKLTDFGLAAKYYLNTMKTFVGTPGYQAPEVLSGSDYDERCDVWSLGVCLFAMITDHLPFSPQTDFRNLIEAANNLVLPPGLSPPLQDLMKKLLNPKRDSRPNLSQIQNHPWLRQGGVQSAGNVAPIPIVFYQVKNVSQVSKFKRRFVNLDNNIVKKCVEKGEDEEKLINDLQQGVSNPATTLYFCFLWPLTEKPVVDLPRPLGKVITTKKKSQIRSSSSDFASTGKDLPPSKKRFGSELSIPFSPSSSYFNKTQATKIFKPVPSNSPLLKSGSHKFSIHQ